jgi:AraC-like DNA-binding protein
LRKFGQAFSADVADDGAVDRTAIGTDRLRGILDLVEASLDEPEASGEDLAAAAYLSRFHFDRLVSSALGEPPGAFRRRLLLERAAYQLAESSASVIEVAWAAGYSAPEAFARAFRRGYGRSPSAYRRERPLRHDLAAVNGVHFHPPGGLRLPALERSTVVDVLMAMTDHHLWLVGEILERLTRLDDAALDRRIELSIEGIDAAPTLRSVADRLVTQLEMWVSSVEGGTVMPSGGDRPDELRARLAAIGPRFRAVVVGPVADGRADETFLDAMCEPPRTFTFGGVLAHVLTFAAVRRTMAIGALASAGIDDLGSGDPQPFVGGGDDAAGIRRKRG